MAQQLNRELSPTVRSRRAGGHPGIYPWDEWTNGGVWLLKRGEDFDVKASGFRAQLNQQASKRGMKVSTRVRGEAIEFQFYQPSSGVMPPQLPKSDRRKTVHSDCDHESTRAARAKCREERRKNTEPKE